MTVTIRAALLVGVLVGVLAAAVLVIAGRQADRSTSTVNDRVTRELVETAHRACVNRRELVRESNRRISSHTVDRDVLADFLAGAARARRAAYARTHQAEDLAAFTMYERLRSRLEANVRFASVPVPHCPRVR